MSNADFSDLLNKYLNDSLSAEELHELLAHLGQPENTEALKEAIDQALTGNAFRDLSDKSRSDIIFRKILQQAEGVRPPAASVIRMDPTAGRRGRRQGNARLWRRIAAAAACIAIIAGYYFLRTPDRRSINIVRRQPAQSNDVAPGRNKAILQLADSSTIVLDDSDTGTLAQQGSTKILKLTNGQLAYRTAASYKLQAASRPVYNIITTPRGGQYQVVLPDGSKVWLNAASSLRFPTAFTGKERAVTVTGEAYFDIAPNRNMPFTVQVNDTRIEVLGTRFNVMSYSNEAMLSTTLLEGAVRIAQLTGKPGEPVRLSPGQQASIYNGAASIIINPVDTESVVAWKNGLFQFESNDVQTIMRQMERWYDVDVHYAGKAPEGHYSWTVGRDQSLMKVLRILEEGGLKFKIEGKNLTVL
jgi:ferric-dicitrate binding protein FerR (iron transport regulator)